MASEAEKRGVRGTVFHKITDAKGTLQFSQQFPDLPNDGDEGIGVSVQGGVDQKIAMLFGTVPKAPYYGDAQLSDFSILLRNTSISQGTSTKPAEIIAYKFKSKEQGGVLATRSPNSVTGTTGMETALRIGDVPVVNRNLIVGSTQVQDHFSSIMCDYFTGTQEGWATDEITVTNQRISRMAGTGGGLYITPETAYTIGWLTKPYHHVHEGSTYSSPGSTYASHSDSSVAKMRQKHGTGFDDNPNPIGGVDADGNIISGVRLIKVTQDSQDMWLKTAINLPGGHNDTVYFKETDVAANAVDFSNTILEDTKTYGDEVTTNNSIFSQVRGSGEFFTGIEPVNGSDEYTHSIDRTGVVRFVSENVVSKGKCCQLYTYISADGSDSSTGDPNYAEPKALDDSHIEAIQDAAAVIGPLPMPMSAIPAAGMGLAEDEWGGNGIANHEYDNIGLYAPMEIKMVFTIPQMSVQAVQTVSSDNYVDVCRRSFAIMFSHEMPDLQRQRFADFLNETVASDAGVSAGLVFLKGGGYHATDHTPDHGESGIFVYDFGTMNGGSAEPGGQSSSRTMACSSLSTTAGRYLGPLTEGQTYELTITTSASNAMAGNAVGNLDDMVATIRTLPTGTDPNGVMISEPTNNAAGSYIIMTSVGDTTSPKTFSVVNPDSNTLTGDSYDSDGEVFRYMSIWNNNTPNQSGQTDYIGHTHANVTAVDLMQDNEHQDMCNVMNIDSIKIGNFNVPTQNSSVLANGQDTHIPSTMKSKSKIVIGSGMKRTRSWYCTSDNFYDEGSVSFTKNSHESIKGDWHGKIPGYTMLHFGSNNATDFFTSAARYLFFNGFNCANLHGNQTAMVSDDNIYLGGGWYSGVMTETGIDAMVGLGQQGTVNSAANKKAYNAFGYASTNEVSGGKTTSAFDHSITIASNTSVDHDDAEIAGMCVYLDSFGSSSDLSDVSGFRQKGLVKLEAQAVTDLTPNAAKRENGFFSAKILAFDPSTGVATVDTVEPFKCDIEQEYIAYIMGGAADHNTMYRNDIKVEKILTVNTVQLNWSGMAADNSTYLPDTDKLPGLWISPYCYWITLRVLNMSSFDVGSMDWDHSRSSTYRPNFDIFTGKWLPAKTYDSVVLTSSVGTIGATYNEFMYESEGTTSIGAVENSWTLYPTKEETLLDLQDYGFGPFTEIEESNHQGFKGGYALKGQPQKDDWFALNNPQFNEKGQVKPGDNLSFLLEPSELDVDHLITFTGSNYLNTDASESNFSTDEAATYRPKFVATYFDALPEPLQNVRIEADETGLLPKLKWDAPSDSDLWFAEIHVSDEPIKHKYHNAFLYAPLSHVGTRSHPLNRDAKIGHPITSANMYILYYNFMSGSANVAAVSRGLDGTVSSAMDDCSSSQTSSYSTSGPYIYMDPEGLAGPRVGTFLAHKAGTEDLPVHDSSFNSITGGTVIKMVPTTNLSCLSQNHSSGGDTMHHVWKINKGQNFEDGENYNEYLSRDEVWPDSSFDRDTTTAPDESWSVTDEMRQELQNKFNISMIVYPLAYPLAEYTLKDKATGGTPVTINNSTSGRSNDAFGDNNDVYLSATVANSTQRCARGSPQWHSSNRYHGGTISNVHRFGHLYEALVKVPITNAHANNEPTGYAYVYHQADSETDDDRLNVVDRSNNPELYGSGATEGGGGKTGIPTDGGNLTVIPRAVLWRIGVDNFSYSQSVQITKMMGDGEKLICYLDSSGLINVWMKILNQNKWLKIRGITALPKDGTTPTHVAVSFDKDLPRANLKLYINGRLEAYTGDRIATGTSNNLQNDANGQGGEPWDILSHDMCVELLGRAVRNNKSYTQFGGRSTQGSADGLMGYAEEFVMLPHPIIYANPATGEAILDKPYSELADQSDAQSKTHYAKMFILDYHNIRGRNKDEIQQTNNISWRKTAFSLDMS